MIETQVVRIRKATADKVRRMAERDGRTLLAELERILDAGFKADQTSRRER